MGYGILTENFTWYCFNKEKKRKTNIEKTYIKKRITSNLTGSCAALSGLIALHPPMTTYR